MNEELLLACLRFLRPRIAPGLHARLLETVRHEARQARMQARIRTLMRRRLHALRRIRNRKTASSPK